ncbi:SDR family oxidoreductase [Alphaproteobacteria bacterium]|nr:SDR family oxidoreductase [Alphaproteobacteria bacterium]
MKTIMVTGGAGFIGSHLCEKLVKQNYKVLCIDNLHTGNIENLDQIINNKNFTFIEHDIVSPLNIKCDFIVNLACPASPIHYQNDPVKTIRTNVNGSINLLELAKKNMATILQASTSEIYGDPLIHPQKESYSGNVNIIGPRSCYDEGKRCAETLFFDYKRQYGLNIKVLRIFNTYGPRLGLDDGRVISNFITQALKNQKITIYGDGSQTRSFCYIEDMVNAFILFIESGKKITGPFNAGNPDEITIKEIAQKIIKITKSDSKLTYENFPQDDPLKRKPDIKLIKKNLNWRPRIDLNNGLKKTIKYFQKKL